MARYLNWIAGEVNYVKVQLFNPLKIPIKVTDIRIVSDPPFKLNSAKQELRPLSISDIIIEV